MKLRVYIVHGSHPSAAVLKAMDLKGLQYSVIEWPPVAHAALQRVIFGARTVPALRIDRSEKIVGSRPIMRRLDQLAPEPPLFPSDPEQRAAVEAAERWGEEVFQPVARTLIWAAFLRTPGAMVSYGEGTRLPMPAAAVRASAPLIARGGARLNRTGEAQARRALAELPAQLDQIDAYIEAGTIGDAERPNAADLQIASTVRLLMTLGDLRPQIEGRPAGALARALWPAWSGQMPAGALAAA